MAKPNRMLPADREQRPVRSPIPGGADANRSVIGRWFTAMVAGLTLMTVAAVSTEGPRTDGTDQQATADASQQPTEQTADSETATDGETATEAETATDSGTATEADDGPDAELPALELAARPGPFQLTIDRRPEDLSADATIEVGDMEGNVIADGGFADNGTALFRELPEGPVRVQVIDGATRYRPALYSIGGEQPTDTSIYDATELAAGFNYIPTRDGTTLSAFVSLPGSANRGPYPTLVEYSGYSPSNPEAGSDPYRLLIPSLGYALVQVNVRGTGCSGGSFDAFERIQSLDGYDVIETVAAQPWSGKVGMFGVSYPGIMQLHVASTRPPSLAAIAPLSVTDGVQTVLYPGGIYNNGFGESWTQQVGEQALAGGQDWAADRIARSDRSCAENQELRLHNPDLVQVIRDNPFVTDLSRERSAETWAGDIDVPTFIAGAWQDEQTGGRFPALLDELADVPVLRANLYNGLHLDAISGEMLVRLIEFFNLYIGDREPTVDPVVRVLIGVGLATLFGQQLELPAGDYDGLSLQEARAAFESEKPIRVLLEQGAENPNLPVPGFRAEFDRWPPAETEQATLYLAEPAAGSEDGFTLSAQQPGERLTAGFTTNPSDGQVVTIADLDRVWSNVPGWDWPRSAPENVVLATSEPLTEDLVLVGHLSADLWVSVADADDADLEVTVSEIAPDGSETYVQAGWLRLSRRTLSDEADELRPIISGLASDVSPVEPGGEPVLARVEVLPFAHVFRTGSRLRITVDTPGASRPQWRFAVAEEPVRVTVHSGPDSPSKIVLPAVPGIDVPTERPPCGNLRGQPCRPG